MEHYKCEKKKKEKKNNNNFIYIYTVYKQLLVDSDGKNQQTASA